MPQELLGKTMPMKPSRSHYLFALLLAGILIFSLPNAKQVYAAPASPWQLQFSLHNEKINNALPTALFVDQEKERYYVVDSRSGQLASFDKEGTFLKSFSPKEPLNSPFDMVRLNSTTLIVVEKGNNSLTTIDFAKKTTTRKTLVDQGKELMVDRLESVGQTLYCLDRRSGQIYKLSSSLKIDQRFPLPKGSSGIIDFKVVGEQIWALGQQEKQIYMYASNGRLVKRIDLPKQVVFPVSLALDKTGNIYILDRHKAKVVVLDRKSNFRYSFLNKGHGLADLFYPVEISFDPWGRLCIVDEGNSRVQIFKR